MRLVRHSYDAPAENLALDEVLLDEAEAGRGGETLRFWMSPVHFVVLGVSQAVEVHVFRQACEADGVPILRRCSAGGCVLQGPGCLNYSLVLRTDRPGCETIHASYRTILNQMSEAFRGLGRELHPAGVSDLARGEMKVSGSAQRRRKHHFLHHGSLLLDFDLAMCAKYLREPADRPDYRMSREHVSFIENLNLDVSVVIDTVSRMFLASELKVISSLEHEAVSCLVDDKYSLPQWNFRR